MEHIRLYGREIFVDFNSERVNTVDKLDEIANQFDGSFWVVNGDSQRLELMKETV